MESYQPKVESAKLKVEKLEAKIQRLQSKIKSNTVDHYDREVAKDDLERALWQHEEAVASYTKWVKKEEQRVAKEMSRPYVKAIEQFLLAWQIEAINYYAIEAKKYRERSMELDSLKWSQRRRQLAEEFTNMVIKYGEIYNETDRFATIEKDMAREVELRRDDLYTRCEKVVGKITEASSLYIGNNGSINGYVFGENGKAEVETIYAGGYNIQCLHYRVLVKKVG